ncbi:MAG: hypothetical protein ACRENE_27125 [Polyangiaceae bacterium]
MYGICVAGAADTACGSRGTMAQSNAVILGCEDCTLTGETCLGGACH